MMKKAFVVLMVLWASLASSSFAVADDFKYLNDVTAWRSATDSYNFSIYYKEGNGEKVYYFQYSSYSYWDIHDNEYYHSPVCNDFRKTINMFPVIIISIVICLVGVRKS